METALAMYDSSHVLNETLKKARGKEQNTRPGRVRARSQIARRGCDNAGAVNFELEARGVVLLGLLPYHMPPQPQKQGDAGLIPRWYYFTLEYPEIT